MQRLNTLTEQEIEAAYLAQFDLGRGYPQLTLPRYIHDLFSDPTIAAAALEVVPVWTRESQVRLDQELESATREFLSIRPGSCHSVWFTFSGSTALDRAITAAVQVASPSGRGRVSVVTTSPSIDIMRQFLDERRHIDTWFVESRGGGLWALDAALIIECLERLADDEPRNPVVVLLTSPENPTGQCWSSADLERIASECHRLGGVLIVDHSFLVAGIHDAGAASSIWNVLGQDSDWIATWDTGKTFGLNEDKIGVIIAGSEPVSRAVEDSLLVIQFAISRRQSLLYARLLRAAREFGYTDQLRHVCRENLATAEKVLNRTSVELIKPIAGSLAVIRIAGASENTMRRHLLAHGIGVVAGSVFFHTDWQPDGLLRIALARDPDYFTQAVTRLVEELASRT